MIGMLGSDTLVEKRIRHYKKVDIARHVRRISHLDQGADQRKAHAD
jgi:hypothetical protein